MSVYIVPKYVACGCRGTKEPSLHLIDDVFLLVVRFIKVGIFNFNLIQEFVPGGYMVPKERVSSA